MDAHDMNMSYHKRWGIFFLLAAVIITLGMLGSAYISSTASQSSQTDGSDSSLQKNVGGGVAGAVVYGISATGSASKKITPDLLTIQLSVETTDKTASVSQKLNAQTISTLLDKLRNIGITENEIQTTNYNVQPVYSVDLVCGPDLGTQDCKYKNTIVNYTTTQTVVITLNDIGKGDKVIDTATSVSDRDKVLVDYTSFSLKESTRNSVENELITKASAEAKKKAVAISSGLNITLGKPIAATQTTSYPYYGYKSSFGVAASKAPSVPTELSPGQIEVTATVSVSYGIKE